MKILDGRFENIDTNIKKEINDTQIELGRNFYSRKTIDDLLNILFSTMVYELLNKGIKTLMIDIQTIPIYHIIVETETR